MKIFDSVSSMSLKGKRIAALLVPLLLITFYKASGAIETIPAGSYLINMGITPQTVGNGLKPYGLVYALVKDHNVPVKWAINPAKAKDGIDFTHNSIVYRGGVFIVPATFRTAAVDATIALWNGMGVVGAYSVSAFNTEIFQTIDYEHHY